MIHAAPPSLRQRLRRETRAAHDTLDETLDLLGRPLSLPQYGRLLRRFQGLHQAVEPGLAVLGPSLMRGRSKLPALRHDLQLCPRNADLEGDERWQSPTLPPFSNRAGALGALYVIEGSTLGGRIIARHLRRQADIPTEAFRYLEIYGDRNGEMWRAVCEELDAPRNRTDADRTIRMAIAMFGTVRAWLDPVHWRAAEARMVGATGFEPVTPTMSR